MLLKINLFSIINYNPNNQNNQNNHISSKTNQSYDQPIIDKDFSNNNGYNDTYCYKENNINNYLNNYSGTNTNLYSINSTNYDYLNSNNIQNFNYNAFKTNKNTNTNISNISNNSNISNPKPEDIKNINYSSINNFYNNYNDAIEHYTNNINSNSNCNNSNSNKQNNSGNKRNSKVSKFQNGYINNSNNNLAPNGKNINAKNVPYNKLKSKQDFINGNNGNNGYFNEDYFFNQNANFNQNDRYEPSIPDSDYNYSYTNDCIPINKLDSLSNMPVSMQKKTFYNKYDSNLNVKQPPNPKDIREIRDIKQFTNTNILFILLMENNKHFNNSKSLTLKLIRENLRDDGIINIEKNYFKSFFESGLGLSLNNQAPKFFKSLTNNIPIDWVLTCFSLSNEENYISKEKKENSRLKEKNRSMISELKSELKISSIEKKILQDKISVMLINREVYKIKGKYLEVQNQNIQEEESNLNLSIHSNHSCHSNHSSHSDHSGHSIHSIHHSFHSNHSKHSKHSKHSNLSNHSDHCVKTELENN